MFSDYSYKRHETSPRFIVVKNNYICLKESEKSNVINQFIIHLHHNSKTLLSVIGWSFMTSLHGVAVHVPVFYHASSGVTVNTTAIFRHRNLSFRWVWIVVDN